MRQYLSSSLGKKQLIAISGIALVLFLVAHLLGNLLVYSGPEALNAYAEKLHSLGPLLWVARLGLLAMFLTHFLLIILLVIQNKKARDVGYHQPLHKKTRSVFTQTMRFSGLLIFVYIGWHLYDYTFTPHSMANSVINGEFYGLYGHVYNSFLHYGRAAFYIVSMCAIGFHLVHGVQSLVQTFGFNHPVYTPLIKKRVCL